MSIKINDKDIFKAGEVANFMMRLRSVDPVRYDQAEQAGGIPHGDLAYGMALVNWIKNGKKTNAVFSYAEGETECKLLMAFAKEISAEFGLPILTRAEAKAWRSTQATIRDHKVVDWLN